MRSRFSEPQGFIVAPQDPEGPASQERTPLEVITTVPFWDELKQSWLMFEKHLQQRRLLEAPEDEPPIGPPRGKPRRGGPRPASEERRRLLIQGWLEAEARGMTQDDYCESTGAMVSSTLRRWMREMKAKGEM
jgi:hypothetical protein